MMKREEVLEKSRKENLAKDPYEQEVLRQAATASNLAVIILATLFFLVHILMGKGINYGLYALVLSGNAATFCVKYLRLKKPHEGFLAAAYTLLALALSAAYLYQLVTGGN